MRIVAAVLLSAAAAAAGKIQLQLYVESGWPECQKFAVTEMHAALTAEGIADIVDVEFTAWGHSYYNSVAGCLSPPGPWPALGWNRTDYFCWAAACSNCTGGSCPAECWSGQLLCQHYDTECYGNDLEACAVDLYPNFTQWEPFVYCLEQNETSHCANCRELGPLCAAEAGLDYSALGACYAGPRNDALRLQNARRTAAIPPNQYGPGAAGTPWVVIDGKVDSGNGLLATLCGKWNSTKPAGCP